MVYCIFNSFRMIYQRNKNVLIVNQPARPSATKQMAQHTLTEVMILLCTVCVPTEGHVLP